MCYMLFVDSYTFKVRNKTWQGIDASQFQHGEDFWGGRPKGWGLELSFY